MTNPERMDFLEKIANQIGEHFDHVQILTTWNDEGGTFNLYRGCGNWHARQGMAHEFINQDEARDNAKAIAAELHPSDED